MPVPTELRNISLGQTKSHLKVSNQLLRPGTSALCTAGAPFPSRASGDGHASPSAGVGGWKGRKVPGTGTGMTGFHGNHHRNKVPRVSHIPGTMPPGLDF